MMGGASGADVAPVPGTGAAGLSAAPDTTTTTAATSPPPIQQPAPTDPQPAAPNAAINKLLINNKLLLLEDPTDKTTGVRLRDRATIRTPNLLSPGVVGTTKKSYGDSKGEVS
jgi:hypothetical protein